MQTWKKHGLNYSKTCVKMPLSKRPKIGFQDQLSLNAGQKYCRMQHSATLSTFIKLPFVIKIFVFSILSGRFYTFTVLKCSHHGRLKEDFMHKYRNLMCRPKEVRNVCSIHVHFSTDSDVSFKR